MAAPHVTSAAAMLLRGRTLTQAKVEALLESTALPIPSSGRRRCTASAGAGFYTKAWDTNCDGTPCDAVVLRPAAGRQGARRCCFEEALEPHADVV